MKYALMMAVVAGAGLVAGCAATNPVARHTRSVMKNLTPESWDEEMASDDPGDPWISAAAIEGRSDQPREPAHDKLRNLLMSPKARAIEENVGYDD